MASGARRPRGVAHASRWRYQRWSGGGQPVNDFIQHAIPALCMGHFHGLHHLPYVGAFVLTNLADPLVQLFLRRSRTNRPPPVDPRLQRIVVDRHASGAFFGEKDPRAAGRGAARSVGTVLSPLAAPTTSAPRTPVIVQDTMGGVSLTKTQGRDPSAKIASSVFPARDAVPPQGPRPHGRVSGIAPLLPSV
jgi:hypothetical protein